MSRLPDLKKAVRLNRKTFSEHASAHVQLKKYGLTSAAYLALCHAQDGQCAICLQAKPLGIDHDHATGAVRGLLCLTCNSGLGMFKDKPELLQAAIHYLLR